MRVRSDDAGALELEEHDGKGPSARPSLGVPEPEEAPGGVGGKRAGGGRLESLRDQPLDVSVTPERLDLAAPGLGVERSRGQAQGELLLAVEPGANPARAPSGMAGGELGEERVRGERPEEIATVLHRS
jgi:hypothetical protein